MTQKERSRDKCHNMCVCFVCNMLKMIVPIPCMFMLLLAVFVFRNQFAPRFTSFSCWSLEFLACDPLVITWIICLFECVS